MTGPPSAASDPGGSTVFEDEEHRIHQVYASREGDRRYSWFNAGHRFMVLGRERRVLELLGRNGFSTLESKNILDIGCGAGQWILDFIKWGARPENIVGIDLLPDRIAAARRNCPGDVTLLCANAAALNLADESFDIIVQSTVFTSILDDQLRRELAVRMLRLLKRDGLILWYDYYVNNPANPNVRAVKRRELGRLFSEAKLDVQRVTLAPPLARWIAPRSWLLCYILELVPFLRTHYLGAITRLPDTAPTTAKAQG